MQRFRHRNDLALLLQHEGGRGKHRVGIARHSVLLCHADVLRIDHLRLQDLPNTQMLQALSRGQSVRSEIGGRKGDDPDGRIAQIFRPGDLTGFARRDPERENSGCIDSAGAGGQQALAIELFHVFGIRRGDHIPGRSVLNLPGKLRGGAEAEIAEI